MKRVIFLIESFPTKRSANVMCDTIIIKEFIKKGYDVTVVCDRFYSEVTEEDIDGIHIIRRNRNIFFTLFTWSRMQNNTKIERMVFKLKRIVMRIKQIITIPIYPCEDPINCLKLFLFVKKILKENNYDILVSEYNGFSTLVVGYLLKKRIANIHFVPIFWDPLSIKILPKYLPKKYSRKRLKRIEDKIVHISDKLIMMESYKNKLDISSDNQVISFLSLPYLSEELLSKKNLTYKNDIIEVVYGGILDEKTRNPLKALEILNELDNIKFNVTFIGHGTGMALVKKNISKFNFKIKLISYLPKEKYIEYLEKSDIFLNIGNNIENAIPSKLIEYIAYRKPIISFSSIENDSCLPYIEKYKLGINIFTNDDLSINKGKLNKFFSTTIKDTIDVNELKTVFWQNRPESFINKITEGMED